jgi:hypothetical protein
MLDSTIGFVQIRLGRNSTEIKVSLELLRYYGRRGLVILDSGKNRQPSGKAMRLRDRNNECLRFIIVTVIVLIIIWHVSAI